MSLEDGETKDDEFESDSEEGWGEEPEEEA
jgi:hypothetical protein